jgi:hypothetical protein
VNAKAKCKTGWNIYKCRLSLYKSMTNKGVKCKFSVFFKNSGEKKQLKPW